MVLGKEVSRLKHREELNVRQAVIGECRLKVKASIFWVDRGL
jgi:hypothetical protein